MQMPDSTTIMYILIAFVIGVFLSDTVRSTLGLSFDSNRRRTPVLI